jgi:two-component system, cell cycle sensor histidine kinase and response regulator CckA
MEKNLSVLIIEDSEDDALLILRELKRNGYDPVFARVETSEAMKDSLAKQAWDAIIADYSIPHFGAPAALTLLEEMGIDLPFIVVFGTVGEETAVEMMKAGAHDYLMKGNLTRLVPALERELRAGELRRKYKQSEEHRKRAEEAMRGSKEKFRNLIETLPIGVALSVPEGAITEMNPAMVKIFGFDSKEELQKVSASARYVNPKDRERYLELLEKGLVKDFEAQYKRKDGTVFWAKATSIKGSTATGTIQFINVFEDITERKEAEKMLSESEQKYRNLVDNATVGVFKTNLSGEIFYINDALIKMLKFGSLEEFIATGVWARYKDPKDREAFLENLKKKGTIKNFESELLTTTGRSRNVLISGTLEGEFISGMIVDITEHHLAEKALRKSEEKYRNLFENLYDVYYRTDLTGLISIASPSVEKLLGYKPDEVIGLDMKTFYVNPQQREEFLRQIKQHGSVEDFEAQLRRKDNSVIWVSTNAKILKDEQGNSLAVEGIARDISERKRVEEGLRESEQRFRELFDNMASGVAIYDSPDNGESFVFADLNESGLKNAQKTKDEVIGQEVREIFPGVEALGLFDVLKRVWRTGIPEYHPGGLYKDNKLSLWVENYVCKLPSGKLVAIYEDTTAQKEAEEALRRSEERYSALVEESFDGIFVQKGPKIIFANRRLYEMLGYNEGDLVGLDHWLVYHPEYQELTRKRAAARMRGEETTTNYEVKMPRKDGSWFYADVATRGITIQGEPGIQVWIRDITERKEAEEYLKKSEARLRSVFEASALGIGLIGKNREILWHNKTTARMLGYSSEEIRGKNTRMLYLNDAEFERVGDTIKTLGPRKRTRDIETRWVRKDGSTFDCHIRHALLDPESEDGAILVFAEDITERKKAEEEKRKLEAQFNQAQRMEAIGVLAGGVAHDFNNLLTAIIGNADLVLGDLDKNSPFNESIEEIRKAGHRAAALTRQLLAFSRKELIQPEILDLNSLMMNLEKMLRRLIGEDIDLLTAYSPLPWQVDADPGQMEQVVMNLAVNARDAMPKGGKLTIETANVELDEDYFREHGIKNEAGPYVMLAVSDSGLGMDKETQARVFEPFFTTKEMGRGTGLGLSTVYGIVKQNNGHIWVHSEPGKGTTFKIYLPKAEKDTGPAKTKPASIGSLVGSETILVVEDDESLRKMAERMLKGYGYRVITARDGEEALEISGSHDAPIHLMLTDVVMPGMSGPDLAEQLKLRVPGIKVLYMSGYTDNAIAHHGVLERGIEFIHKPFTREGLATKVREILDRKQDLE